MTTIRYLGSVVCTVYTLSNGITCMCSLFFVCYEQLVLKYILPGYFKANVAVSVLLLLGYTVLVPSLGHVCSTSYFSLTDADIGLAVH